MEIRGAEGASEIRGPTGRYNEPPRRPDLIRAPEETTKAQRIAGVLLVVNAIQVLVGSALVKNAPAIGLDSPAASIVPALIDLLIGVSLMKGKRAFIPWAIVRIVLGTILYTAHHLTTQPLAAIASVLYGFSLLALLVGNPGKARFGAGLAMFGLYAAFVATGFIALFTGTRLLATPAALLAGDIEEGAVGEVRGVSYAYSLTAPGQRWHLRKPERAQKENPLADRWLTRPDKDAHVIVIPESTPGALVLPDRYAEQILSNMQTASTAFSLLSREPLPAFPDNGFLIRANGTVQGIEITYYYGVIAGGSRGFQIAAFAPRDVFASVEDDFRQILGSFTLPKDALRFPVPDDVEPLPVSAVEGLSYGYTLKPPGDRWHLRKTEAVKRDNAEIDRWLTRPGVDAHVFTFLAHVPGAKLPIDAYTDEWIKQYQKLHPDLKVISREPLRTFPENGRLLRATATQDGVPIDYLLGVVTAGDRSFEVLAVSPPHASPLVKDDFLAIIESFALPATTKDK